MKVLIVSDTHGREDNLEKVLEKESPIDAMVHLGDVEGSEDYIRILTDAPVYMVAGNNDFYTDLPGQAVIDLDGYRAFITHGHGYHVSYSPNRLVAEALHRNAQIAMYGHTHVPHLEQVGRCDRSESRKLKLSQTGGAGAELYHYGDNTR